MKKLVSLATIGRSGLLCLTVVACFVCPACSQTNRNKITLSDDPQTQKTSLANAAGSQVQCLPVLSSGQAAGNLAKGHHKVLFRWNPSAASLHPENNAVGYCLYRSKVQGLPKNNPRCAQCELVNIEIIPATNKPACVDDQVADDTIYYYVATAIDKNQNLSVSSNEVPVIIPVAGQQTGNNIPPGIILCRNPGKTWDQP